MNKTPVGRKFLIQLTKVNDQLCYSALLHYEFEGTIACHAEATPNEFAGTIFPLNPHSERLNRKAKDLLAFGLQSAEIGFRMAIIAGFEHTAAYLEEVQSLRAAISPSCGIAFAKT